MTGQIWKVLGSASTGGLLVREGPDLCSKVLPERLPTGASVRAVEVRGGRLHFERLSAGGPARGWVSLTLHGRALLEQAGPTAVRSAGEAAIAKLVASHRGLHFLGGRVELQSEAGRVACQGFLDNLEAAAEVLGLEIASRAYRKAFTGAYRALFPSEARGYRADVLEASMEQCGVILINDAKFEFSAEAMRQAQDLQVSWANLAELLESWDQAIDAVRPEHRNAMRELDLAWARFEDRYISDLLEIETKARQLIAEPVECERTLRMLEARHGEGETLQQLPEYREELGKLVGSIARLNSVANSRRKGRDDLKADILLAATRTLSRCRRAESRGENVARLEAAQILSADIINSFMALRKYLHEIEGCLDRVNPHLSYNAGLVSKLADWEESWEVGARYVRNQKLMNAVCDLVAEIKDAQKIAPALASMREECDVELFMVLPRILWLRFLQHPGKVLELFKSLMPSRFAESEVSDHYEAWLTDPVLASLHGKYQAAMALLEQGLADSALGGPSSSEMLVERAVDGTDNTSVERMFESIAPSCRTLAQKAVEDFMHDLEALSIELQRYCPEDWNDCSSILVRCLSGHKPKAQETFRI
eukprot:TRINITY_DN56761_c0_g1_i1.p1 TRINITY_DN56761_c0_g1~~TRINITY_DN56761_c0_g1_i1.p1  ORF type:complete len:595 (+),score=124.99 TRINITY_DN56761_c0_g1_i1:32-1816(+)